MAISQKIQSFLKNANVAYKVHEHPAAYTSQEIAGAGHVPGSKLLKAVIVKNNKDNTYLMVVVTTNQLVDFDKLGAITKDKDLDLASEEEIASIFPDYELGAEPPFGNLYNLKVYADRSIEENDEVFLNGGTHTDLLSLKTSDYLSLINPIMGDIGRHI